MVGELGPVCSFVVSVGPFELPGDWVTEWNLDEDG